MGGQGMDLSGWINTVSAHIAAHPLGKHDLIHNVLHGMRPKEIIIELGMSTRLWQLHKNKKMKKRGITSGEQLIVYCFVKKFGFVKRMVVEDRVFNGRVVGKRNILRLFHPDPQPTPLENATDLRLYLRRITKRLDGLEHNIIQNANSVRQIERRLGTANMENLHHELRGMRQSINSNYLAISAITAHVAEDGTKQKKDALRTRDIRPQSEHSDFNL